MALGTLTKVAAFTEANRRTRIYDIQLTSGANYTTGGETITPQQVGLGRRIELAVADGAAKTSSGSTGNAVAFLYQANGSVKLVVYGISGTVPQPLNEQSASANLSTFSVRVRFTGV